MARHRSTQPTNAELAILRVLWDRGPSTVREVHDALEGGENVGYTTVLKILQIMVEKGQAKRSEVGRGHVYRAAASRETTQQRLVTDLIERAFGGSAAGLVMQALSAKPATAGELERIRDLIDRARAEDKS